MHLFLVQWYVPCVFDFILCKTYTYAITQVIDDYTFKIIYAVQDFPIFGAIWCETVLFGFLFIYFVDGIM